MIEMQAYEFGWLMIVLGFLIGTVASYALFKIL